MIRTGFTSTRATKAITRSRTCSVWAICRIVLNRLNETQARDVPEIAWIECPDGGAVGHRTGGDGQVDFPPSRARHFLVEASRRRRFCGTERDRMLGRKQL